MSNFRFPLEKALAWRRTRLELAEARLEQQLASLTCIDRDRTELESEGRRAEVEVRALPQVAGEDLEALAQFRRRLQQRMAELAAKRVECLRELAVRQAAVLEARREFRLLERLREKRRAEWQAERDRELEQLAADCYLAGWSRGQKQL